MRNTISLQPAYWNLAKAGMFSGSVRDDESAEQGFYNEMSPNTVNNAQACLSTPGQHEFDVDIEPQKEKQSPYNVEKGMGMYREVIVSTKVYRN